MIRLLSENPAIVTPSAQDLLETAIQMNEDTAEQLTANPADPADPGHHVTDQLAAEIREELATAEFANLGGSLGTEADISAVNTGPMAEHEESTVEQYAVDESEATAAAEFTAAELAAAKDTASIDLGTAIAEDKDTETEEREVTEAIGKVTVEAVEKIVQDMAPGWVIASTVPASFNLSQGFDLRSDIYNIPERVPQHLNPNYPIPGEWVQLQDEFNAADEEKERADDPDSETNTEEQNGYGKEE